MLLPPKETTKQRHQLHIFRQETKPSAKEVVSRLIFKASKTVKPKLAQCSSPAVPLQRSVQMCK